MISRQKIDLSVDWHAKSAKWQVVSLLKVRNWFWICCPPDSSGDICTQEGLSSIQSGRLKADAIQISGKEMERISALKPIFHTALFEIQLTRS